MASFERITVTLPSDLLKDMDRQEKTNRSRFVATAVRNEIHRRQREELNRSLRNPHPETLQFADESIGEWLQDLPEEDAGSLVDMKVGNAIQWISGQGWVPKK